MPRAWRRVTLDGRSFRQCLRCQGHTPWPNRRCRVCGRTMLRQRKRTRRKTDKRRDAEQMRDRWLAKLALAITKVQFYTRRARVLAREGARPQPARAARLIRLRD